MKLNWARSLQQKEIGLGHLSRGIHFELRYVFKLSILCLVHLYDPNNTTTKKFLVHVLCIPLWMQMFINIVPGNFGHQAWPIWAGGSLYCSVYGYGTIWLKKKLYTAQMSHCLYVCSLFTSIFRRDTLNWRSYIQ